jgi:hypothetical protein
LWRGVLVSLSHFSGFYSLTVWLLLGFCRHIAFVFQGSVTVDVHISIASAGLIVLQGATGCYRRSVALRSKLRFRDVVSWW